MAYLVENYGIPALPLKADLETKAILKELSRAHRYLAELKGRAAAIPNQGILIDTLSLQEAKASSEIENIVTTQDEIFQTSLFPDNPASPAAKEVALYRDALRCGYENLIQTQGLITNNSLIDMFQVLKRTTGGFRRTPGTALKNDQSGDIVYVPPQDGGRVQDSMGELEKYINEDSQEGLDPLIKMAVIHHQFESIHPFPDGNGRIGRILNVLYLTKHRLLDIPILYLSRFITQNKGEYYALLQSVRDEDAWEAWVLYMLRAVGDTAIETLALVESIRQIMADYKSRIRHDLPKIYSQDLLNNLFRHPYTRIDFVERDLGVVRQTAARYLEQLTEAGFLSKHSAGRSNYYVNGPLVALFNERENIRAEDAADVRTTTVEVTSGEAVEIRH